MSRFTLPLLVGLAMAFAPAFSQETKTTVELVEASPPPEPGSPLGTRSYGPSQAEKPHLEKLAPLERAVMVPFQKYDLTKTAAGTEVGWVGIVRRIEESADGRTTRLTVEHKYFNGLTDLHQLVVNFNGSGDFEAVLQGTDLGIRRLALVRIYGRVRTAGATPVVEPVAFVRQWEWGAFAFIMASGEQRGSERWRRLNKVPLDRIYDARPGERYYVDRLGPRETTSDPTARRAEVRLHIGPGPEPMRAAWRAPDGAALELDEVIRRLREEGVRRRDRRRRGEPFRATTRLVIVPDAATPLRHVTLAMYLQRQDIGIEDVELEDDGRRHRLWSHQRPDAEGVAVLSATATPAPGEPRMFTLVEGNRPGAVREVPAERIEEELGALAARTPGGVLCIQGTSTTFTARDAFALARRAEQLGLEPEFTSPLLLPRPRPRPSFGPAPAVRQSDLTMTCSSTMMQVRTRVRNDRLWFAPEAGLSTKGPHRWTRISGSAAVLMALPRAPLESLHALVDDLDTHGRHASDSGSLYTHAWLTLAMVRLWKAQQPTAIRSELDALLRRAVATRLPDGGWPADAGTGRADLMTSALLAMALREAIDGKLVPSEALEERSEAWLSAASDARTGRMMATREPILVLDAIESQTMHRVIHGRHPEVETAAAAAYGIALGRDRSTGLLSTRLDRLVELPPRTGVATHVFDVDHAFFTSWILSRDPTRRWRRMALAIRGATSHYVEMRGRFVADETLGEREIIPLSLCALVARHLEAFSGR